jgi:hypothetical protein
MNLPERIWMKLQKCKGVLSWPHDLGYFLYVPKDHAELVDMAKEGAPGEVMQIMRYALNLGCSMIDLREDVDPNRDLPVYDRDQLIDILNFEPAVESSPSTTQEIAALPGWYGDPSGQARLRWWDGEQWTGHVSN